MQEQTLESTVGGAGNALTGAEAMVQMLQAYGVKHLFGLCGDTTLPFYDALARLDHGISHILARDERHGAYMADAYARVTGRPGVCEGPSGGGATYLLPGLVEANESSIPVLGITTDVATGSRGRYPLTELDQVSLFKPLTKWNASLDQAGRLPALVRAAFRAMTTGRPGAVHLALPFDTQKSAVDPDEIWADPGHRHFPANPMAADPGRIEAAVHAIATARRALVICGGGPVIAAAGEALAAFAGRFNLPVATTISGQGAIAETHPLAVGVVGSNGGVAATRAVVGPRRHRRQLCYGGGLERGCKAYSGGPCHRRSGCGGRPQRQGQGPCCMAQEAGGLFAPGPQHPNPYPA